MFVCMIPLRSMASVRKTLSLALLMIPFLPTPAVAQAASEQQHFGVNVSFAPFWKSRNDLLFTMGLEDTGTFEGTEFSIGFVRGRTLGGDWGVSYVRKPFKDATGVFSDSGTDECGAGCTTTFSQTQTTSFEEVYVRGVEVHWAPTFVTISNRLQIGMNIAGGIAVPEGTITQTFEQTTTATFQGQTFTDTSSDSFTSPANEVMYGKVPLFKVEAQVGVILAPGLKFRVAGGLNNPGLGVRIGAVYLIGAN
jgi:hypothetical protein